MCPSGESPPFNPAEAVAYSCNYFFATTGERLDGEESSQTCFASYGFGQPTGIDAEDESAGVLARPVATAKCSRRRCISSSHSSADGNGVRSTLQRRHVAETDLRRRPQNSRAASHRRPERATLLEGMRRRSLIRHGCERQTSIPFPFTSPARPGLQLNCWLSLARWFVGVAFKRDTPPEPANAQLVVVVYLKNAHGSDAAELARPIFEEFARSRAKR